jgi:hypothetical protein
MSIWISAICRKNINRLFTNYNKGWFPEQLAVEAQTLPGSTTEGGKVLTDSSFNLEGVLHWIPKQNTHSKELLVPEV